MLGVFWSVDLYGRPSKFLRKRGGTVPCVPFECLHAVNQQTVTEGTVWHKLENFQSTQECVTMSHSKLHMFQIYTFKMCMFFYKKPYRFYLTCKKFINCVTCCLLSFWKQSDTLLFCEKSPVKMAQTVISVNLSKCTRHCKHGERKSPLINNKLYLFFLVRFVGFFGFGFGGGVLFASERLASMP